MDKKTLHRILVHPTRTGLDKVEKEVARLNGVNVVLRQELMTWKDAVATRNETIEVLNNTITKLHDRVSTLEEDRCAVNIAMDEKARQKALRVDGLRQETQRVGMAVDAIYASTRNLSQNISTLYRETMSVRSEVADGRTIDWDKEAANASDDTDTE